MGDIFVDLRQVVACSSAIELAASLIGVTLEFTMVRFITKGDREYLDTLAFGIIDDTASLNLREPCSTGTTLRISPRVPLPIGQENNRLHRIICSRVIQDHLHGLVQSLAHGGSTAGEPIVDRCIDVLIIRCQLKVAGGIARVGLWILVVRGDVGIVVAIVKRPSPSR